VGGVGGGAGALVLQATNDAGRARGHPGAEVLAIVEACFRQWDIEADVGRRVLHDLQHPRLAPRVQDLIPAPHAPLRIQVFDRKGWGESELKSNLLLKERNGRGNDYCEMQHVVMKGL